MFRNDSKIKLISNKNNKISVLKVKHVKILAKISLSYLFRKVSFPKFNVQRLLLIKKEDFSDYLSYTMNKCAIK